MPPAPPSWRQFSEHMDVGYLPYDRERGPDRDEMLIVRNRQTGATLAFSVTDWFRFFFEIVGPRANELEVLSAEHMLQAKGYHPLVNKPRGLFR